MNKPKIRTVTIMCMGQVLVTDQPKPKDHEFVQLVVSLSHEFMKTQPKG